MAHGAANHPAHAHRSAGLIAEVLFLYGDNRAKAIELAFDMMGSFSGFNLDECKAQELAALAQYEAEKR